MTKQPQKPTLAIHKLTSCSGCQAVILNMGEDLLALLEMVEIVHFVEAGICNPGAHADIALIEGSVSTDEDQHKIHQIRSNAQIVIAVGACACSGGVQALRNARQSADWSGAIYASPEYLDSLETSRAISREIKVDLELWGCPISTRQLKAALGSLLHSEVPVTPRELQSKIQSEKVCQECKRRQQVCVLVARGLPCLGPVTRAGCGALCPQFGAPCYTCFGPAEQANCHGLARRIEALGLPLAQVAERFASISVGAAEFDQLYHDLQIPLRQLEEISRSQKAEQEPEQEPEKEPEK